jgi:general secretion pathway protein E
VNARLEAPLAADAPAVAAATPLPGVVAPWRLRADLWGAALAQRWRTVLVADASGAFHAVSDRAADPLLHERLENQCDAAVQWLVCDAHHLEALLREATVGFRAMSLIDPAGDGAGTESSMTPGAHELSAQQVSDETSPVLRLLDSALYDALTDRASDVHFECTPRGMAVRMRVDGVLAPLREIDGSAAAEQLVSRLKVMAELDIGERRLPQDGRFKLRAHGREVDFRLSIMPSVFGEDAVVRILDRAQVEPTQGALTLASLGFDESVRETVRTLAARPHGLVLVTGPTGSGKTTTLYAAINEINTGLDKIVTIEDPVEYQLAGVVQIPVNEKKGLTFARGLRSILRHDPDRVMVGEIRDPDTAQIAVQAALTGHLVFSTVHANGTFDVIGRLMHMGLDLHNLVSALQGVVAQRLLRLNCPRCTVPCVLPPAALRPSGFTLPTVGMRRGAGCGHCRFTGYRGRRAIAELLVLDDALRDLIASRASIAQLRAAAVERGFRDLRATALDAVRRGETTLEEADRVTVAG